MRWELDAATGVKSNEHISESSGFERCVRVSSHEPLRRFVSFTTGRILVFMSESTVLRLRKVVSKNKRFRNAPLFIRDHMD